LTIHNNLTSDCVPRCPESTPGTVLNFPVPELLVGLVDAVFVHDEVAHEQPSLNMTKTNQKKRHVRNNCCTALKLVWTHENAYSLIRPSGIRLDMYRFLTTANKTVLIKETEVVCFQQQQTILS
jgi:hypothetical protein